jgi:hypothetical protein
VKRLAAIVRCLLAALVLLEGAGVARALGHGADVHCCCGKHSVRKRCGCKSCPVVKKRASAESNRLAPARQCDGAGGSDAALLVLAVPSSAPALAAAPRAAGRLITTPLAAPRDRWLDPIRPPP